MDDSTRLFRARCLVSPYFFVKVALNNPDMAERIHGRELERLVERMKCGLSKRYYWVEWSRGFLKSTTFTMGFSVWLVLPSDDKDKQCALEHGLCSESEWDARAALRNQNYSQLVAFETATNAGKKLNQIRRFFEDSNLYSLFHAAFPEIIYQGTERPWNDSAITIRRDPKKHSPPDPTFEAKGVGGALQSGHYDVIWCDDIVGKDAIESEVIMAKTKAWFGQLNGVEQLGGKTWRFGVSNRWGFNDLNAHLKLNEPHWEFSRLDAEVINEKGERVPTWPEMYPIEVLDQKKASMSPEEYSCQYLNNPKPPGENDVDADKVHLYVDFRDKPELQEHELFCTTCQKVYSVLNMNRYLHYDPYNAKGRFSRSRPAIAAVGTSTDKHVFLLEAFQKKLSYEGVYKNLFRMGSTWKPRLFTYEDVGGQNMAEFFVKMRQNSEEFKRLGYRKFDRIKGVKTQGKPMEIRIRDYFFPVIENKKFGVHKSHRLLFDMLETFPHEVPTHDYDLLDVLAQGATEWRYPVDSEREQAFLEAEQRHLENLGKSRTGYSPWAA